MIIVRNVTPNGTTPLATFELTNGKMVATYASGIFEREMEGTGIYYGGKTLKPEDGQAFLDALPKVYARSTIVEVESSED